MFGYNISLLIPLLMHRKISLFKLCPFSILDLTTTCERGKADKSVMVRKCSDENTTKRVKRERDRISKLEVHDFGFGHMDLPEWNLSNVDDHGRGRSNAHCHYPSTND